MKYILIGVDMQNNLTAPIAKRRFETEEAAIEHAEIVMSSASNPNLLHIIIMQGVKVARRANPPIEIVPIEFIIEQPKPEKEVEPSSSFLSKRKFA